MTGYTVHTGSNDKFRDGWDNIFKSRQKKKSPTTDSKKSGKDAGKKGQPKKR